jgi:hypothetical protein
MEEKFSIKKAVSLTLALSFVVMSYTGILLFFTPKGKIANWTDWSLLGLTKTQYTDLHITSMFLFLAAGIWHIYFNWKPLMSYLKTRTRHVTGLKKELLLALVLNAFFVGGTLSHLPPMQSIVDINSRIKAYWETVQGAPPFGHAEEATVASLASVVGIDTDTAMKRLRSGGIRVESTDQTLQQIAQRNGLSAKRVYEAMAPGQKRHETAPVSNLGRRTLEALAAMGYFDADRAVAYLKARGFDASPQTRMRDAATALGTTPYALFDALRAEEAEK